MGLKHSRITRLDFEISMNSQEQTVSLPAHLNGNELKRVFNLLRVDRDLDREQRLVFEGIADNNSHCS